MSLLGVTLVEMNHTAKPYDYRVEAQPIGFFETPVAYGRLTRGEDLLQDLETAIRQRMAEDKGVSRSNIGSWHSDTHMTTWGGKAATKLAETAIIIAKRLSHFKEATVDDYNWTVRMWANVTPAGGMNHMHAHPGNLWAAVLYIDMGDDENSASDPGGRFYIEDPRFPLNAMHNTALRMIDSNGNPQEYQAELNLTRGNIIVFPAWLRHGVRTYTGNRQRVSIALNIDAQRKQKLTT